MKKGNAILIFAVMFLFFGSSGGLRAATEVKAVPVAGNLFYMEGLEGCNVVFLVTEEGVLVVDSGTTPDEGRMIMEEIAKKTDKPVKYLVLTHYHSDHTFGLQAFPAATVVIGQQNTADNIRRLGVPRCRDIVEKQLPDAIAAQKKKLAKLGRRKGGERAKAEAQLQELEADYAQMKGLRFVYPSVTFDSQLRLCLGGQEIEVIYPGPAHTDGDALVHFPGLKVAHMGDLVFNGIFPYIGAEAGADTANWIAAVEKASAWDVGTFVPGHGPLTDRQGLLRMASYLTDLRAAVKGAIAAGQSLEQMKKMPLLPAWKDMAWREIFPQNVEAVYGELTKE
jgi:glyoxylase-like metal-dependent hydrolase (beta-lactamase superfamily II)